MPCVCKVQTTGSLWNELIPFKKAHSVLSQAPLPFLWHGLPLLLQGLPLLLHGLPWLLHGHPHSSTASLCSTTIPTPAQPPLFWHSLPLLLCSLPLLHHSLPHSSTQSPLFSEAGGRLLLRLLLVFCVCLFTRVSMLLNCSFLHLFSFNSTSS